MLTFDCPCGRKHFIKTEHTFEAPPVKPVPTISEPDHDVLIPDSMLSGFGFLDGGGIHAYLLKGANSWLGRAMVGGRLFAYYLEAVCREFDIEPIYVLAMIQREQSALFMKTPPSQHVQDKLMGYGVPDGTKDATKTPYYGLEKQLRGAVWQLRHYMSNPGWISKLNGYMKNGKRLYDAANWKPATMAEAVTATYTPHLHAVKTQAALINRIAKEVQDLGLAQAKG